MSTNAENSRREARTISDQSVLTRTVILSSLVLTGIFILLFFLEDNIARLVGSYADEATTGLMLLTLWLVVGSAVRSANGLVKGIPGWQLVFIGMLTGAVGGALFNAFLLLFPRVSKAENTAEIATASGAMVLLLAALAFLISLVATVKLRVRNRSLAHVLEFLIILGCIFGVIYFMSR